MLSLISNSALTIPFLNLPSFDLISVILSNINIGGDGKRAFPSPNRVPLAQLMSSL